MTNAHVARRPRLAVGFADGRQLQGHLLARDESMDLALLSIAGQEPRPATPLDATLPRIGSLVIAVGHPFGVRRAATVGIVHALGPLVPGGRNWIQADLRLAPGNSGGPIANATGRVVGVSTMVMSTLGLAVPVSEIERFVRRAGPG